MYQHITIVLLLFSCNTLKKNVVKLLIRIE